MKYPHKLFRAAASAICVCWILWSSASGQQEGTVSGVVLDQETGKPVPMVNVWLEGTSRWCTTDTAGSFLLRVPLRAKAVLVFNHVAYRDTSRALYLEHGAELVLRMKLEPRTIPLRAIDVISERRREERLARHVLRSHDILQSGEDDFQKALHYVLPEIFPKTRLGWWNVKHLIVYVDSVYWDPAELDELDPKGVKRVIIWDTKWSWAPFPSRPDTRFVVSVETK